MKWIIYFADGCQTEIVADTHAAAFTMLKLVQAPIVAVVRRDCLPLVKGGTAEILDRLIRNRHTCPTP